MSHSSPRRPRPPNPGFDPPVEKWAWKVHEAYERLAPTFGLAIPWEDVSERNRLFMQAVAAEVLTPIWIEMQRLRELRDEWRDLARRTLKEREAADERADDTGMRRLLVSQLVQDIVRNGVQAQRILDGLEQVPEGTDTEQRL